MKYKVTSVYNSHTHTCPERLVNLEHWNDATSGKFFPIFGQNAAILHVYREKKELVEILTDFVKQVVAIYLTSGGESDMM